jgi:hypothetical protein
MSYDSWSCMEDFEDEESDTLLTEALYEEPGKY